MNHNGRFGRAILTGPAVWFLGYGANFAIAPLACGGTETGTVCGFLRVPGVHRRRRMASVVKWQQGGSCVSGRTRRRNRPVSSDGHGGSTPKRDVLF